MLQPCKLFAAANPVHLSPTAFRSCDRLANTDGTCALSGPGTGFTFPTPLLSTTSKALMFSPASSTTLVNVTLGVGFSTTATYTVTFSLYESTGALLNLLPAQLATATFSQTWQASGSRWKTFNLASASPPFAVTGGKTYALIVSTPSNGWSWTCCPGSTLPSGLIPGDFTNIGYTEFTTTLGLLTLR